MIFALKKCIFLLDVMLQLNILWYSCFFIVSTFPIPYNMRTAETYWPFAFFKS